MFSMVRFLFVAVISGCAAVAAARTIHRSFRTRDVSVGGGFGVAVPVDRRVDKAIDEAHTSEDDRARIFAGKTGSVRTNGSVRVVRRTKIVNPKAAEVHGGPRRGNVPAVR